MTDKISRQEHLRSLAEKSDSKTDRKSATTAMICYMFVGWMWQEQMEV